MILNLIPLLLTAAAGYYIYKKFIAERLDSPTNNPNVKGLEKDEIKAAVKEGETKQKEVKEEIKQIEKERKDILAGSDADKADKAKEKLEVKEEKAKELKEIETNLEDLKVVEKGGWKSMMPNKIS
ncbi:1160_t:CDS:1 [Ambispora gerdemannii]|uniref:1160_t:CDS:1 n=1 Tax=Ambispora gerdemannii TaxID=144530 RepID=A0A9N9CZ37_9GLOM|nr:1160_t:CDS:1 [Ambispora gerdemannii]